jgi:hypothetical protein
MTPDKPIHTELCAYCGNELIVARLPWKLRDGQRVFCNLVHKWIVESKLRLSENSAGDTSYRSLAKPVLNSQIGKATERMASRKMTEEKKPIHVEFAEKCMGWIGVFYQPEDDGEGYWLGRLPLMIGAAPLPRVDQPGFDLGPWEEVNGLSVRYYPHCGRMNPWEAYHPDSGYIDVATKREAVLRCLIALADAGKLVRPR